MKNTRAFLLLALTCAAILVAAPQVFAGNVQLLTNPGFEDAGGSYNGWFTFGSGPNISTAANDNIFRSGAAASKIFGEFNGCPIPNFDVGGYGQSFTPTAGQVYTFTGYSFVADVDPMLGSDACLANRTIAKIVFFDAAVGGNEITSNEVIVANFDTPTEQWIPFSVSALCPPGAVRVEALILFLQPGCDTGAAFLDDLVFCEELPQTFQNVLANPSFDTDLSGWTTFGNVFFDGRSFARRTPGGGAALFGTFVDGSDSGMFQRFATSPGEEWRLGCWALNTCAEDAIRGTNANVAYAIIEFRDAALNSVGSETVIIGDNTSPLGTWTRYEVTGTAPAGAANADALIIFTQGPLLENGKVFVDDVNFTNDNVTGVGDTPRASGATLYQNVPNPFNPTTQISFDLAQRDNVEISVYDVKGRLVNNLFEGELGIGPHSVTWDGTDFRGATVSSGVYLYVLRTSAAEVSRRMVLLK